LDLKKKEGRTTKTISRQSKSNSVSRQSKSSRRIFHNGTFNFSKFRRNPLSNRNLKLTTMVAAAAAASLGAAVVYFNPGSLESFSWSSIQPEILKFLKTCQSSLTNLYQTR